MLEIATVFPHLTSLELKLNKSERLACREFWELWPNLEDLKVKGDQLTLVQNYDADFCGIHQEEVELLREMDEGSLGSVQTVPIRPSLLTMRSKCSYL